MSVCVCECVCACVRMRVCVCKCVCVNACMLEKAGNSPYGEQEKITRSVWILLLLFRLSLSVNDDLQWKKNIFTSLKYSVFHRFRQAKIDNGWFNVKLEPIFATAPAASKNETSFKGGQNQLKIIGSLTTI
jgi:hypothetical protein